MSNWIDVRCAFEQTPPPLDYVLPGLKGGTVGALIAPGGTGKTMLALQAAVTVAGGPDMLGLNGLAGWTPTYGRVVYLSGEDTADVIVTRLHAIGAYLSPIQRETVIERLHIAELYGCMPDLMNPRWQEWLNEVVFDARLVVIDTLRRFHTLDENDAGAMAKVVGYLESVCRRNGTTVVYVHHTSKSGALNGGDAQQASRGSSVLTDNVRWQANLITMTKEEAEKFGVDEEMRRRYVRLSFPKINYSTPIEDRWYRRERGGVLQPVELVELKPEDDVKGPKQGKSKGKKYDTATY
jgi:RecA-family ATPase